MKAFLWVVAIALSCSIASAAEKQLKPGESEIYNNVLKDLGDMNFTKAVADLDTWQQKYPDSDFKDERSAFYVQAWAGANQPEKTLDAAAPLLSKDLNAAFPGPAGQAMTIRTLYNAASAIVRIPNPTPAQLTAGEKAAHDLMDYDQPLPGVTAGKWAEARTDMRDKAAAALLFVAMLPGRQAMAKQPPDCAAAESACRKALVEFPEKAALSYELGRALYCEAKTDPEKLSPAIYEFVRAATIDPTQSKIVAFAETAYRTLHGSDEGLDQLRRQVRESAQPPQGFHIQTAAEIEEAAGIQFEKDHPELALWMKIKSALAGSDGNEYFASQLKDAAVPQLAGTLVEAKPSCRPRELLVAMQQAQDRPQITLKLDKPLPGKPELNTEIRWEGVAAAFTKDPFMLTMNAEGAAIQGLKTTPCTATPSK